MAAAMPAASPIAMHGGISRDVFCASGRCRVVPPGNQKLIDTAGQQRPVRRVVVTPARDAVGEVDAVGNVVVGHDVLAPEHTRLAYSGLRRHVDELAALEAR